jgi:hypothetical protein
VWWRAIKWSNHGVGRAAKGERLREGEGGRPGEGDRERWRGWEESKGGRESESEGEGNRARERPQGQDKEGDWERLWEESIGDKMVQPLGWKGGQEEGR